MAIGRVRSYHALLSLQGPSSLENSVVVTEFSRWERAAGIRGRLDVPFRPEVRRSRAGVEESGREWTTACSLGEILTPCVRNALSHSARIELCKLICAVSVGRASSLALGESCEDARPTAPIMIHGACADSRQGYESRCGIRHRVRGAPRPCFTMRILCELSPVFG